MTRCTFQVSSAFLDDQSLDAGAAALANLQATRCLSGLLINICLSQIDGNYANFKDTVHAIATKGISPDGSVLSPP
jgi:hypothetical protein